MQFIERTILPIGMIGLAASSAFAASIDAVDDAIIDEQREELAESSAGAGPQAPRDIDQSDGTNERDFGLAPDVAEMNLCNIHFHENAEHKGGEFTTFAGNGNGEGYNTGFKYDGELSAKELAPIDIEIGASEHGDLTPGDTIEIHYVYSTAEVEPGPTLGSCLSEAIKNPQLRVEGRVYVLINDDDAADFVELNAIDQVDGVFQAVNLPNDQGDAVTYQGSTTGPTYNEEPSPYQVTWSVAPKVKKVNITSVANWLDENPFDEDHAHGVRNLVINPELLSPIGQN